jgi:indolepyruvate ferredoxin oxidoreductase beta subunit
MPVITGACEYPEGILEVLAKHARLTSLDALALAESVGSGKAVNVVLIGVLAATTDIPKEEWVETIRTTVPPKFLELNLAAFERGYTL